MTFRFVLKLSTIKYETLYQDFVRVLAHFQPISKNEAKNKMNSKREKLMFSFRMYDLDGDGEISKVRYQKLSKLGKFYVLVRLSCWQC